MIDLTKADSDMAELGPDLRDKKGDKWFAIC